jgi:hypothetical protein
LNIPGEAEGGVDNPEWKMAELEGSAFESIEYSARGGIGKAYRVDENIGCSRAR